MLQLWRTCRGRGVCRWLSVHISSHLSSFIFFKLQFFLRFWQRVVSLDGAFKHSKVLDVRWCRIWSQTCGQFWVHQSQETEFNRRDGGIRAAAAAAWEWEEQLRPAAKPQPKNVMTPPSFKYLPSRWPWAWHLTSSWTSVESNQTPTEEDCGSLCSSQMWMCVTVEQSGAGKRVGPRKTILKKSPVLNKPWRYLSIKLNLGPTGGLEMNYSFHCITQRFLSSCRWMRYKAKILELWIWVSEISTFTLYSCPWQ